MGFNSGFKGLSTSLTYLCDGSALALKLAYSLVDE